MNLVEKAWELLGRWSGLEEGRLRTELYLAGQSGVVRTITVILSDVRERLESLEKTMFPFSNQKRVAYWIRETLGESSAANGPERTLRLVEEAVELAQACDVSSESLHRLVDYVFQRPVGDPAKEVAGVMVTLYGAASALDVDAQAVFEAEMSRIWEPEIMERVRRRQVEKREATRE